MFTDKDVASGRLDKYFRVVHALQLVAVLAMLAGMVLTWWSNGEEYNLFRLLNESLDLLRQRSFDLIAQPLGVLWAIWPGFVLAFMRAFTGVMVVPVSYRRLALILWGVSALALGHFLVVFGMGDVPSRSPLAAGEVQIGYWLTASSTLILGLLILTEWTIRGPEFSVTPPGQSGPVDDAERLWRGEYLTCPFCGMLNEPGARACYNCKNLLFDFTQRPKE
ncbi:MAG: hypothetical protein GYB65_01715 [Chloroflexi bacterium]|nr:hypothetical protein [Chloroflexota bacterium]